MTAPTSVYDRIGVGYTVERRPDPRWAGAIDGEVRTLLVPHDCTDAVLWGGWRRPERYLDPAVLAAASSTAALPAAVRDAGIERLRADLADGTWHRRHADLLDRDAVDGGFRLVIAGSA